MLGLARAIARRLDRMVKMRGESSEFTNSRRYDLSQHASIMTAECDGVDRTIPFHQARRLVESV